MMTPMRMQAKTAQLPRQVDPIQRRLVVWSLLQGRNEPETSYATVISSTQEPANNPFARIWTDARGTEQTDFMAKTLVQDTSNTPW
jgi:hypothetical protein